MHTYKVVINQTKREIVFLKTAYPFASTHPYTLRDLLRLTAFFYGRRWRRHWLRGTGIIEWEPK